MKRTAIPLAILGALITAVMVMQYRWLTELADAARFRMERDLRVAVQATAGTIDFELARNGSALRPGRQYVDPALDSAWIADTLLPLVAERLVATAELDVTLAVARIEADGSQRIVASTGSSSDAPDVTSPIFSPGGTQRLFFMRDSGAGKPDRMGVATWSTRSDNPALAGMPAGAWELRAWHADGSLEGAAARLKRRNLAIGFGLMTLLTAAGGFTFASWHRGRRLAEDRAAILAGISHEARTPLAVIRSAADNLAGGVVTRPDDVAEYGRMIEAEAGRLTGVVDGALDFARMADPRGRAREQVDLRELLEECARGSAAPSRVTLVRGGAAIVHGDRHSLATAIRNLVANALAYSPEGSPVEVALGGNGRATTIIVADRGSGIDEDERARVLEPFQRGRAAAATGHGGLGLGLSLADRVARMHGGKLTHGPREGGGTRFTLELPRS
jgi:signal transduction histidine kinase